MGRYQQSGTPRVADPTVNYPYTVYIDEDVLAELQEYARAALPTEIGGLARVQNLGDGDVLVDAIKMLPQRATGGHFQIDADAVATFLAELANDGRVDEIPQWISIVHSHPVGMGPSMSGTDVENIKEMADDSHFFSLIISASHDASCDVMAMHHAQVSPYGDGYTIINDMPVEVMESQRRRDFEAEQRDLRKQLRDRVEADASTLIQNVTPQLGLRGHRRYSSGVTTYSPWRPEPMWWDDDELVIPGTDGGKRMHEMTDEEFVEHLMTTNNLSRKDAEDEMMGIDS